jgi:hypothetical protein
MERAAGQGALSVADCGAGTNSIHMGRVLDWWNHSVSSAHCLVIPAVGSGVAKIDWLLVNPDKGLTVLL